MSDSRTNVGPAGKVGHCPGRTVRVGLSDLCPTRPPALEKAHVFSGFAVTSLAPDKNGANGVTPFLSGEGPNSAGKTALHLLNARTEGLINFAMTGIRLRRRRSRIHNNIRFLNFGRMDISNSNILTSASLWGFFSKQRII